MLDAFDMSLGAGLGKLKGRSFRIGHLGNFNDLMLAGTLSGVEMGLVRSPACRSQGAASPPPSSISPPKRGRESNRPPPGLGRPKRGRE